VRDGVTGLLTSAATADDLDSALLELYRRPGLRRALAGWGRRHAENEWSLAACYHSFFVALHRTGLADRLSLARKITFPAAGQPPAPPEFLGADAWLWRRGAGIGQREGPHPQYGMLAPFHWCCGPESRFELSCRQAGRHLLVIEYQNLYFDPLPVELYRGAERLGSANLEHTSVTRSALGASRMPPRAAASP
jgi:hypothetical protein